MRQQELREQEEARLQAMKDRDAALLRAEKAEGRAIEQQGLFTDLLILVLAALVVGVLVGMLSS